MELFYTTVLKSVRHLRGTDGSVTIFAQKILIFPTSQIDFKQKIKMVIEDKAIIGKLKKFSSRIQEFFSLGSNLSSCQTSGLFLPFGCTGEINGEQNDPNKYQRHVNTSEPYGSGEISKHRPPLSQTYPQWKVMCDVQKIHSSQQRKRFKKRTMYILPLGSLHEKEKVDRLINEYNQENVMYSVSLLHVIIEFMSLFFYGMKIKLLAFQDINSLGFKTRVHDRSGKKQVLVTGMYLKWYAYVLMKGLDISPNVDSFIH